MLNFAAPALISSKHMTAGMHVIQYFMADDVRSIGLALMPVFSYTRNGVWKEDATIMQYISHTGAHVDRQFYLNFKEKCVRGSFSQEMTKSIPIDCACGTLRT